MNALIMLFKDMFFDFTFLAKNIILVCVLMNIIKSNVLFILLL